MSIVVLNGLVVVETVVWLEMFFGSKIVVGVIVTVVVFMAVLAVVLVATVVSVLVTDLIVVGIKVFAVGDGVGISMVVPSVVKAFVVVDSAVAIKKN